MLTHLNVDQVRTVMRLSARAEAAGDRLVNRATQVDLADGGTLASARDEQVQANADLTEALRESELTGPVQTLDAMIARMSREACRELYAIALIGRGDYAARQWDDALAEAESRSDDTQPRALADMESLSAFLAKGLYQLGLT